MNEDNNEEFDTSDVNRPLIDLLTKLIENESFKEVSNNYIEYLKDRNDKNLDIQRINQTTNEKHLSHYKIEYWQDISMVTLVLTVICFLSYTGILEATVTGTLLGSVIGYALSHFRDKPKLR